MRLQQKFLKSFFFIFLIGILIPILLLSIIINYYNYKFIDENISEDVSKLENTYSDINMNSVNILIVNDLTKLQLGLNQQIAFYNNLAENIINGTYNDVNISKYVLSFLDAVDFDESDKNETKDLYSAWFVDQYTSNKNLTDKSSNLYKQLLIYSALLQSFFSFKKSMDDLIYSLFFIFDDTNLLIDYPLIYDFHQGFFNEAVNYTFNPSWCTDKNGNKYSHYKFQCRPFYYNSLKISENLLDNSDTKFSRTIFISNPYNQFEIVTENIIYTICIKFIDKISKKNAHLCADINQNSLGRTFDSINNQLRGYFLIVAVGYKFLFYFPRFPRSEIKETLTEYIFNWNTSYYLEEKLNFKNNIEKLLISNHINKIKKEKIENDYINIFDEILLKENKDEQYFFLNGKVQFYSLFPVILKNEDQYEHVLSIIYIYNKESFYKRMLGYHTYSMIKIFLCLGIFFISSYIVLYFIVKTLNILAKYIVIPVKNIQYMIHGINVGGRKRLDYLDSLKNLLDQNMKEIDKNYNIHEEGNIDKDNQEKMIFNNNEQNESNDFTENNLSNDSIQKKDTIDLKEKSIQKLEQKKKLMKKARLSNKKYNKKCDNLEKELNFYDFKEELLQYRSKELNELVKVLLELKDALILTSKENNLDKIINYSDSEKIFQRFKNIKGVSICQSNIGNMISQLNKYDKAIYHLVLSLQDIKLKQYLSQSLTDEFDESNTLLNLINSKYICPKEPEKNKLDKKQDAKEAGKNKLVLNQEKVYYYKHFPSEKITVLVNERYNKLIYIYYRFFSILQKSEENSQILNGYYMHKFYHSIKYYHKILIQYIYLCYKSEDLVKIGESILDYIEFLIKFKLKTSKEFRQIMSIKSKDERKEIKKKYFVKVLNWLNLFNNYYEHLKQSGRLDNAKGNMFDKYEVKSNNNKNSYNNSANLFKINVQRSNFLKGKFAYVCENYDDALFFFIVAAKESTDVYDGLIKKRALKHIMELATKMKEIIKKQNLCDYSANESIKSSKKYLDFIKAIDNENEKKIKKNITLLEGIELIIKEVDIDIKKCEAQQSKDIILIIDGNNYNPELIDTFKGEVKSIIKDCLDNKDRFSLFIFDNEYHILSPMMYKSKVDIYDLFTCIDNLKFDEKPCLIKDSEENEGYNNESSPREGDNKNEEKVPSEKSQTLSNNNNNEGDKNYEEILSNIIKFLNFCISYIKMKEIDENVKYLIYFTNIFNYRSLDYNTKADPFGNLQKEQNIHFLIFGRKNITTENTVELMLKDFGSKSEYVRIDENQKIQNIISSNNTINDNIIFSSEIYK